MEIDTTSLPKFPTTYKAILSRIEAIDPIKYGITRNYTDGAVSYLSPYISRGVISTRFILNNLICKGYTFQTIEKFVQELAWRDYWQRVWQVKGDEINADLRHDQKNVTTHEVSSAVLNANTGIHVIDKAIEKFYQTGYLHNHVRMYLAAIACNLGGNHWKLPAQWMYYHLLDADWASNGLSWQWVAGSNSNKKYYANQENINRFCHSNQRNTFLDVDYAAFESFDIPPVLIPTATPEFKTPLPKHTNIDINPSLPTYIYNFYNLDPKWMNDIKANRILLLEPSQFQEYPIDGKSVEFMIALAQNIPGLQIYAGEFVDLHEQIMHSTIYYKEHPLNRHYKGTEVPRDWMTSTDGYFPSFFKFWKQSKKEIECLFVAYHNISTSEK